ncbi:unnamed protein product [Ascophyllum nodosum]
MSVGEGVRWAKERFPGCRTVVSQATRLSGVLAEVWEKLADPSTVQEDRPCVLLVPDCPAIADARGLQGLYEHLEVCQDACERFGREVSIVPHPKSGRTGAPVAALVVQAVEGSDGGTAEGGGEFAYDPAWDDEDWDIDRSLLGEDEAEDDGGGDLGIGDEGVTMAERDQAVATVVPDSDEEVTEQTKAWVQAVITDMGVCPFSVDASRAGLPVGLVRYPVSREATSEAIYRDYWREVDLLISERDERSLSTTLLIAPEFALNNAEAFEIMGQTLTQPLEALRLEDDIQLVFFHPQYSFRDGQDRIGSGGAANYARRSPFPMINILRTTQVRLAQKSIPTGLVYKQNEEVLDKVGASQLQKMLERRDWTGLEGKKVTLGFVGSAADVASARESLTTAAGSMRTSYDQGFFSGDDDDGRNDIAPVPEAIVGQTTTSASPPMASGAGSGGALEAPAASSAGIADEDLRVVATTLVKRLGSGRPLKSEADFEAFSEAVDRILRATAAA